MKGGEQKSGRVRTVKEDINEKSVCEFQKLSTNNYCKFSGLFPRIKLKRNVKQVVVWLFGN